MSGVLADGDLAQNKDWRACPHVAHLIFVGTDQDEVAAAGVDEHAKGEARAGRQCCVAGVRQFTH